MAERKLKIMVVDTIKPGKEAVIEGIMKTKLIPALRKQLPDFHWTTYRPIVGNMGQMIVIASVTADQLVNYDQFIIKPLEREHGKEQVARYLQDWYDCLQSSEYIAIAEEAEWSNS